ncbi:sigma-54 interaction domain-containing protein [Halobacillus massiliensis]|uniref:sigma-54 interaction domain-containing protein n=1 Tax=Halobacillus massiliensis TaxID=1926286 RepID=UPI0009E58831|nr:sigma 54-interacting transcriptional regulator [Halobacillus massiliensis]
MRHSLEPKVGEGPKSPLPQQLQLLDSIIQSSYDGIFVADASGIGWTMNDAYTRITGVPKHKLLHRNLKDAIEEGVISDSVTYKVLDEKKAVTIVQSVNGVEVLATGNPVKNEEGEITHVVTNIRDLRDLNYLKFELHSSNLSDETRIPITSRSIDLPPKGVVAKSRKMKEAFRVAEKAARVDSTILLTGESGAGKEIIANFIQGNSKRSKAEFVKVNCGAIPSTLLEAELFGYEKGAFTGAVNSGRIGLFEKANGGTILLDEIGDIPLELQVKLLRVLQEKEIRRVGGTYQIPLQFRVIAATNRNLEELVKEGGFREDLYYRLSVIPIHVPPLRERREDITPIAFYYLQKLNESYDMAKTLHPDSLAVLEHYKWPGNIRELENVLERAAVISDADVILPEDLSILSKEGPSIIHGESLKAKVQQLEIDLIREALNDHKTTRKAAKALGISQSSLVKKMKKYELADQEYIHE